MMEPNILIKNSKKFLKSFTEKLENFDEITCHIFF